jgi:hypothetical protein
LGLYIDKPRKLLLTADADGLTSMRSHRGVLWVGVEGGGGNALTGSRLPISFSSLSAFYIFLPTWFPRPVGSKSSFIEPQSRGASFSQTTQKRKAERRAPP